MRLFVAVEIAPAVGAVAVELICRLRERALQLAPCSRMTWTTLDRLHVTVRFIGHVDAEQADAIRQVLAPPLEELARLPAGAVIAVNGTDDEAELVRGVIENMRNNASDLTGVLSLSGLCGLIERAAMVVSNDSGPLHLSSAIGKTGARTRVEAARVAEEKGWL